MTESDQKEVSVPTFPPKTVACVLGPETRYDVFRAKYVDIFKQVADMEQLVLGRISYTGTLNGLSFTLQSLKQSETALTQQLLPAAVGNTPTYSRDISQYVLARLALALTMFNNKPLPCVPVTFSTELPKWLETSKAKLDMLADFDEMLIAYLSNVYDDIILAKRLAFAELVENPFPRPEAT